jgi:hypothetical protein
VTQLTLVTFGPQTVVAGVFDGLGADRVVVFGSWAARYHGSSTTSGTIANSSRTICRGPNAMATRSRRGRTAGLPLSAVTSWALP